MDYDTGDIDFERVAMLLSVVKDCAGVGPQLMSISSAAMHELVDMNKDLSERQTEAGKKRIADEQARAAQITAKAQEDADRAAEFEANQKTLASRPVKPINVKPGEPNELEETEKRLAAAHPSNTDENIDVRRV